MNTQRYTKGQKYMKIAILLVVTCFTSYIVTSEQYPQDTHALIAKLATIDDPHIGQKEVRLYARDDETQFHTLFRAASDPVSQIHIANGWLGACWAQDSAKSTNSFSRDRLEFHCFTKRTLLALEALHKKAYDPPRNWQDAKRASARTLNEAASKGNIYAQMVLLQIDECGRNRQESDLYTAIRLHRLSERASAPIPELQLKLGAALLHEGLKEYGCKKTINPLLKAGIQELSSCPQFTHLFWKPSATVPTFESFVNNTIQSQRYHPINHIGHFYFIGESTVLAPSQDAWKKVKQTHFTSHSSDLDLIKQFNNTYSIELLQSIGTYAREHIKLSVPHNTDTCLEVVFDDKKIGIIKLFNKYPINMVESAHRYELLAQNIALLRTLMKICQSSWGTCLAFEHIKQPMYLDPEKIA